VRLSGAVSVMGDLLDQVNGRTKQRLTGSSIFYRKRRPRCVSLDDVRIDNGLSKSRAHEEKALSMQHLGRGDACRVACR
jgi:hypothetical protein